MKTIFLPKFLGPVAISVVLDISPPTKIPDSKHRFLLKFTQVSLASYKSQGNAEPTKFTETRIPNKECDTNKPFGFKQ